jgi:hypothetical protein
VPTVFHPKTSVVGGDDIMASDASLGDWTTVQSLDSGVSCQLHQTERVSPTLSFVPRCPAIQQLDIVDVAVLNAS